MTWLRGKWQSGFVAPGSSQSLFLPEFLLSGIDSLQWKTLVSGSLKMRRCPTPSPNGRTRASASTLLQGAIEGHVLVKNSNGVLPLNAPQFLSLYGYDATSPLTSNPGSTSGFFIAGTWHKNSMRLLMSLKTL